MTTKVFLSAVTGQFRECRNELASDLRAIGCEVKVQEDFQQGPRSLIEQVQDYVDHCDRVIALVGDAYGCEASGVAVPPIDPPRSYTQWEYGLALGQRLDGTCVQRKDVYLYLASDRYLAEHPVAEPATHAARQRRFRQDIEASGEHWTPFDTADQLCRRVLRDGWQITERPNKPGRREGLQGTSWKKWTVAALLLASAAWILSSVSPKPDLEALNRRQREKESRKFAVAAGQSFAMIGQSTDLVGQPLLEHALERLGIPGSLRQKLCRDYEEVDHAFHDRRLEKRELLSMKTKLAQKVREELRTILGDRPLPYFDLGQDLAGLMLLLRDWDQLGGPQSQSDLIDFASTYLESLQHHLDAVHAPPELTKPIRSLRASGMTRLENRAEAFKRLEQILVRFAPDAV
jgi:hypothetical protein